MQRFWSKVDRRNKEECWNWKASTNNKGYGFFWYDYKMSLSHRIAWILTNGAVPKDKIVLHRCDSRICCNPDHLYIGTYSDNNNDRSCRNSDNQGGTQKKIYSADLINKVVKLVSLGKTQREIAKVINTSQWKVWNILNRIEI